jgi:putative component of membrane protein insertase Oxa1/YidC/SpoIIIJ protein YidD
VIGGAAVLGGIYMSTLDMIAYLGALHMGHFLHSGDEYHGHVYIVYHLIISSFIFWNPRHVLACLYSLRDTTGQICIQSDIYLDHGLVYQCGLIARGGADVVPSTCHKSKALVAI